MNHVHIPVWQRWMSHLFDIELEAVETEYNEELYVTLSKGRVQLSTASAIYSHEDKYFNFSILFEKHLNLNKLDGNKVLILGLGLGSIPIILDKLAPGQWDMSAVEFDEMVCSLASKYTYPKLKSSLQTHIVDAEVFVDICQESYDLICVDLFINDKIPEPFKQKQFLSKVKDLLNKDGVIVYNTPAFYKEDQITSKAFYRNKFCTIFNDAQMLTVHRNYMLVSDSSLMEDND